jgi:hypothetical protein
MVPVWQFGRATSAHLTIGRSGRVGKPATKGAGDLRRAALGMIAGAIAMVVYCGLAAWGVRRLGALAGSVLVLAAWGAVAGLLYWVVG